MALQITNSEGIYEFKGNLNSENVLSICNYLETLFIQSKFITISLNRLVDIDSFAVVTITRLHKKAMKNNKLFTVLGLENPIVNKEFQKTNSIAVLKSGLFLLY